MDLKVILVVVCLCSLAITLTDAGIPKCCIRTSKIHPAWLKKAQRWWEQSDIGVCDIEALVVYVKGRGKPFCLHPKMRRFLEKRKVPYDGKY
uniref:Chemokine interleukin-8-like domain-containing protein n=1 Tax=Cyprinodon variegatus TaxID=28743 RepID=A0A3Q2EGE2_CYPVA